jgi:twitching motility protein PilU
MEREQAQKFMHDLLRLMVSKKASDLFVTAGFPPAIKVDGRVTPVSNQTLTPQHTVELTRARPTSSSRPRNATLRSARRTSGASA